MTLEILEERKCRQLKFVFPMDHSNAVCKLHINLIHNNVWMLVIEARPLGSFTQYIVLIDEVYADDYLVRLAEL